jgi:hypothetical protein
LTERTRMDDPAAAARRPLWQRLVWFVGLWLAGVVVVGVAAFVIRLALLG